MKRGTPMSNSDAAKRYADRNAESVRAVFVQGNCPACGVAAVFVGDEGYLTCSLVSCSNPLAPSEALGIIFPGAAS